MAKNFDIAPSSMLEELKKISDDGETIATNFSDKTTIAKIL